MIHAEFHFPADTLGMRVSMTALLPEHGAGPFATLYLLHGLSDDHTMWSRMTRLEQYAARWPMAIVMPEGFRGFYTDNAKGPPFARYMMDDVIGTAERIMPLRTDRAGCGIGGLSMGGYGALRLGLASPGRFVSVHSHSGALMYPQYARPKESGLLQVEYDNIFGDAAMGTPHDLVHLAERLVASRVQPPAISIDCGVDDFLIASNRSYHATLDRIGLPHAYQEFAGEHNWAYWDEHVKEALAFHAKAMGLQPIA